jgi:phosphatidylglycerophosphatase A
MSGIGFIPVCPGTWASLASIPILYFMGLISTNLFLWLPVLIILTVFVGLLAGWYESRVNSHDVPHIVLDEFVGMLTTWLCCPNSKIMFLLIQFALFRLFDIIKIWPASSIDRKMRNGWGVVLDDVTSGLYAGFAFLIIQKLIFA